MNPVLRRISKTLLWVVGSVVGVVLLCALCLSAYFYFHRDAIRQMVLSELNEVLTVPVNIEEAKVVMWRNFPSLSVEFKRVQGMGSRKADPEPLFSAEKIYLNFNLISMLKGRYEVDEIKVSGGEFNLKRYADLSSNYIIWHYDSTSSGMRFNLRKIVSKNTLVRYQDLSDGFDVQFLCRNIQASGSLSGTEQEVRLKGSYRLQKVGTRTEDWLRDHSGRLNVVVEHNAAKCLFTLRKGDIEMEDLKFSLLGEMAYDDKVLAKNTLNFSLTSQKIDIEDLLASLPDAYKPEWLGDYDIQGEVDINASMNGCYKYGLPDIKVDYTGRHLSIEHKTKDTKIEKIEVDGAFVNANDRAGRPSQIQLRSLSAQMGRGRFTGAVKIENLDRPTIELKGRLTGDVAELSRMVGENDLVDVKGEVVLDLRYRHTFPAFDSVKWGYEMFDKAECEAHLLLTDFYLAMPQSYAFSVKTDSAKIVFYNRALTLYTCLLKLNNQEMRARIHIENLLPYWGCASENLYVSAEASAEQIKLEELAALLGNDGGTGSSGANGGSVAGSSTSGAASAATKTDGGAGLASVWQKNLLDHLYLTFTLQAGVVQDKRGPFEHVRARVHYQPDGLQIDDLTLRAYGGRLSGKVRLDFGPKDSLEMSLSGRLDSVQVDRVLASFDNFGQDQITAKHITGALDMDFDLMAVWSPRREFVADRLLFSSDLHLRQGALHQVEALKKLSKFTGEADLEHIRFADLHNHIDIAHREILIPRMSIVSSLMNLDVSGIHRFDNTVDYRVVIELSDFLSRRRKQRKADQELGLVETRSGERMRLPIHITGPASNPTFRYDRTALREEFKDKFAKERDEIKAVLSAEKQHLTNPTAHRHDRFAPPPSPADWVITFEDDAVDSAAVSSARGGVVGTSATAGSAGSTTGSGVGAGSGLRKPKTAPKRDTAAPIPVKIEWEE